MEEGTSQIFKSTSGIFGKSAEARLERYRVSPAGLEVSSEIHCRSSKSFGLVLSNFAMIPAFFFKSLSRSVSSSSKLWEIPTSERNSQS